MRRRGRVAGAAVFRDVRQQMRLCHRQYHGIQPLAQQISLLSSSSRAKFFATNYTHLALIISIVLLFQVTALYDIEPGRENRYAQSSPAVSSILMRIFVGVVPPVVRSLYH